MRTAMIGETFERPGSAVTGECPTIHGRIARHADPQAPALLPLHGYPQNHLIWRHCMQRLCERFTVVAADLRGYGRSSKPATLDDYLECFRDPETVRAMCEDYRAAATIDIEHDDADEARVACPMLALWGADGIIGSLDPMRLWRMRADDVRGFEVPGGHYLPEESPAAVPDACFDFRRETGVIETGAVETG